MRYDDERTRRCAAESLATALHALLVCRDAAVSMKCCVEAMTYLRSLAPCALDSAIEKLVEEKRRSIWERKP